MLGGLDNPTEGSVLIHGKDITKMKSEELTVYRRKHIGFVFQNYNLLQTLNVKSNILLPLYLGNSKIDEVYFEEIVEILGIKNKLKNLPNTLSGGQQQRVAIARAMITKPDIVLADEPTGNLDSESSEEVLRLLRESGERYNQTIIMITHSKEIAVFKTTKGTYSSDNLENSPDIGETVTIYKNGKPLKKVEVISQILVIDSEQISGSSVTGDDTILGPWLYLGEGLFKELYGKGNLVNYSFDADEKDAPAVRRMLNQISQEFADVGFETTVKALTIAMPI